MKQKLIHIIIRVIFLLLFFGHVVNDISMWFSAKRQKKANYHWIPIAVCAYRRNHHHHLAYNIESQTNRYDDAFVEAQMITDAMRMICIHFQRHKISTNFSFTAWPFQCKHPLKWIFHGRNIPRYISFERNGIVQRTTLLTRASKQTQCQHKNNVDTNHLNAYTTENALHNPSFIHQKTVCEEILCVNRLAGGSPFSIVVGKTISHERHSKWKRM